MVHIEILALFLKMKKEGNRGGHNSGNVTLLENIKSNMLDI